MLVKEVVGRVISVDPNLWVPAVVSGSCAFQGRSSSCQMCPLVGSSKKTFNVPLDVGMDRAFRVKKVFSALAHTPPACYHFDADITDMQPLTRLTIDCNTYPWTSKHLNHPDVDVITTKPFKMGDVVQVTGEQYYIKNRLIVKARDVTLYRVERETLESAEPWTTVNDALNAFNDLVKRSGDVFRLHGIDQAIATSLLVTHSLPWIKFNSRLERGWLEGLILGETRTGKTTLGKELLRTINAGTLINGEAAIISEILGTSNGHFRALGTIPNNANSLIIMDETSGVHNSVISRLSEIRSSGVFNSVSGSIESLVRILWLSNKKQGTKDGSTLWENVCKLFGLPEDRARLDLVTYILPSANTGRERLRKHDDNPIDASYIRWLWTAPPPVIEEHTMDTVYDEAETLSKKYSRFDGLVEPVEMPIKILRLAGAFAALNRTFEENTVKIHPVHVLTASWWLNQQSKMLDRVI